MFFRYMEQERLWTKQESLPNFSQTTLVSNLSSTGIHFLHALQTLPPTELTTAQPLPLETEGLTATASDNFTKGSLSTNGVFLDMN